MGKVNKQQSGFSIVEVLIVLVIIGLLGLVGWWVYHDHQNANTATITNTKTTSSTLPAAMPNKTYTDSVGNFSVVYPSTWKVATTANTADPKDESSKTTLTSPGGTVLNLNADSGGKGGDCQSAATDKPFQAGNACPSLEYLSSETVPINNVYYADDNNDASGNLVVTYKPADIVLVTSHFDDSTGASGYYIGLTESTPQAPVTLNQASMGAFLSVLQFSVYNSKGTFYPYIYAYASGSSPSFLTSSDAATIKTILRSMKVNI